MATQVIHVLKQSGEVFIRQANRNLQIPGFKKLEGCETTVSMDLDPEVFILLEPIHVFGFNVTPHYDMHICARRLRTIFSTTMLFFRWGIPNGEQMLRERGIENLPGQIFDEIKTTLSQPDAHFSRFSPAAIKRCLKLFMENVLPQDPGLLSANKDNTTARDPAREA